MVSVRAIALLLWSTLAVQSTLVAQATYTLVPNIQPGKTTAVQARFDVSGHLKVVSGDEVKELPMQVAAQCSYHEQRVGAATLGVAGHRTLRHYSACTAKVTVEGAQLEPELSENRRLIVVDSGDKELVLFSPLGPLTRDELDLIDMPGPTPLLQAILPDDAVSVGDSWELPDAFWARLLRVDAISKADVETKLAKVESGLATIESQGLIYAAIGGVATEFDLKLRVVFHIAEGRFTQAVIAFQEDRSIGHVGPGVKVTAKVQLAMTPAETPDVMTGKSIQNISLEPVQGVVQLTHKIAGTGSFDHPRDWYVLTADSRKATLRLVRNGELLAQCNLAVPHRRQPGQMPTLQEFQAGIKSGLSNNFGRFVEAGSADTESGDKLHRVVASGIAADLPIRWIYFMLNEPKTGREVVFTFVVEESLAKSFERMDWNLVGGFAFSGDEQPQDATARGPSSTQR
jgi:hypothetical protein